MRGAISAFKWSAVHQKPIDAWENAPRLVTALEFRVYRTNTTGAMHIKYNATSSVGRSERQLQLSARTNRRRSHRISGGASETADHNVQLFVRCERWLAGWLRTHVAQSLERVVQKNRHRRATAHISHADLTVSTATHTRVHMCHACASCVREHARTRALETKLHVQSERACALELTQILCNTRKCGVHVAHGRVCILFI